MLRLPNVPVDRPAMGISMVVVGLFLFALQDVVIKGFSDRYSVLQLVFVRGLVAMIPILIAVVVTSGWRGRFVVAWMVARKQNSALAQQLMQEAMARYAIAEDQLTIHQDRGALRQAPGTLRTRSTKRRTAARPFFCQPDYGREGRCCCPTSQFPNPDRLSR